MTHCKALQDLCGTLEMDALLLTGDVNRFYATDLHTSAGLALISATEAVFMTDFRYIEAAQQSLPEFKIQMVTRESGSNYEDMTAKLLADWGVSRLGFEEESQTVKAHEQWGKKLNVTWVPAQTGLNRVRSVKADWEIERMTRAQRIAERALEQVLGLIKVGMTERQVAAELVYHMLKYGADKMSFDPIVVSGPNSSLPHGEPGDRALADGDFLTMDFGCMVDGYCSDMTRTVAVGHATEEMRKVYGVVLEAQRTGIEAVRAGVVGHIIHEAAAKVIAEAGYGEYFGHGFGHGIGIEVHEAYSANPSETRTLPAGAVISAEPGIYLPGRFGVRIEDCVVLKDGGCENLMKAPKELRIL